MRLTSSYSKLANKTLKTSALRSQVSAIVFAAIIVTVLGGCEHAGPFDPSAIQPKFSSIQQNVFSVSCAVSGCHLGSGAPWGLDLSENNSYGNLVGRPAGSKPGTNRVTSGDADASYLIRVLEGGPDINVPQMPFGRGALPGEQIQAIRDWIDDGAQDN